jgi:hypothetical protein
MTLGQRIVRNGAEQLWDFVLVLAKQEGDGTLSTRVLLCHPDWNEPLQVVSIQSTSAGIKLSIAEPELVVGNHE